MAASAISASTQSLVIRYIISSLALTGLSLIERSVFALVPFPVGVVSTLLNLAFYLAGLVLFAAVAWPLLKDTLSVMGLRPSELLRRPAPRSGAGVSDPANE